MIIKSFAFARPLAFRFIRSLPESIPAHAPANAYSAQAGVKKSLRPQGRLREIE